MTNLFIHGHMDIDPAEKGHVLFFQILGIA